MTHYIVGWGSYGCLFDSCSVHESREEAAAEANAVFELPEHLRANLANEGFAELPKGQGADYIEIVECDCTSAHIHED